jgi:hypothetical protein
MAVLNTNLDEDLYAKRKQLDNAIEEKKKITTETEKNQQPTE